MNVNDNLESFKAASGYSFSATKMDKLGASEYTLVTVAVDVSGSVTPFRLQIENCLKTVFKSMAKSPRSDNLMFRVVLFDTTVRELHGFKLLSDIKEEDYTNSIQIGGMTSLFEAMDNSVQALSSYGKNLTAQDFLANGIVVVITDGQNNMGSISNPSIVAKSIENAKRSECLESLQVILVGITNDDVNLDAYLKDVKENAGVDSYISIGNATPGKIAKLAEFISQSVSSTSQALGTGGQSSPIAMSF
jgi:hypothetical protein